MISYKNVCERFVGVQNPTTEVVVEKMRDMDGMSLAIFVGSMLLAVYVNLLICQYLWNNELTQVAGVKKATIWDLLGVKVLLMFLMS